MVTLICGDRIIQSPIKQAEDLLHIQKEMKRTDWKLAEDSPYEYKNNVLVKRANSGDSKEQTKKGSASKSAKPRAETKISHGDYSSED